MGCSLPLSRTRVDTLAPQAPRTYHETPLPMTSTSESPPPTTPTFRKNLIRVIAAQVGALLLLWLLQSRYTN
jgi:hypothetical protein